MQAYPLMWPNTWPRTKQRANSRLKTSLDGAIKNAIAASDKVHVAADANDFDKVEAHMKTLVATMSMVEKQITTAK